MKGYKTCKMQADGKIAKYDISKKEIGKANCYGVELMEIGNPLKKTTKYGSSCYTKPVKIQGHLNRAFLFTPRIATSNFSYVRHTAQHGQQPRYGLDDFRGKFLARAREFFLLEIFCTGSGDHPAPVQWVQGFFQEDKAFGTCSWPLASSSVERKNESKCTASWGGRGKFLDINISRFY
jgi:hypothetical protein